MSSSGRADPDRRGVAVVTDSTAGLVDRPGGADDPGLRVVPLHVIVDDLSYAEGRSINPAEVGRAMRAGRRVSTSRPSPAELARVYGELAAQGWSDVVSVHLSGQVSGTVEAAHLAAGEAPLTVRVVDTGVVGAGLGLAVRAGARAARAGATAEQVEATVQVCARAGTTVFCVDSLEWLRRGGRISAPRALVGTALAMRPVLGVRDGQVVVVERVRTTARAVARVRALAVEAVEAAPGPVDVVVQHLDAVERAEALAEDLRAAEAVEHVALATVGAVIGAHAGPGTLGVVVAPRHHPGPP